MQFFPFVLPYNLAFVLAFLGTIFALFGIALDDPIPICLGLLGIEVGLFMMLMELL